MPPKGWRKHAEGTPQHKDVELVSIDEILFPKATIQKLAKGITADNGNMILSKDLVVALQRAATVFVSHMMYHGRLILKDSDRKIVSAQDMLAALERADLGGFVPVVKQKMSVYEHNAELKKKRNEEASAHKKLKTNTLEAVRPGEEEDETLSVEEEAEAEDVEDEEIEDVASNPIALLGKEEEELGGTEEPETVESDDAE